MMEAVRTSETSAENHVTRQYIPEDNSEHRRRQFSNWRTVFLFQQGVARWQEANLQKAL
jgi:hypothetical protein